MDDDDKPQTFISLSFIVNNEEHFSKIFSKSSVFYYTMSTELTLADYRRTMLNYLKPKIEDNTSLDLFLIVEQIMHSLHPKVRLPEEIADKEDSMLKEIVWDLVFERILTPTSKQPISGLQNFRITEYGKKVLSEDEHHPHDPYGYIASLKKITTDPIILTYVEESLQAYLKNLQISSAITLGAASERGINILLDALIATTKTPRLLTKFEKLKEKKITQKHKGIADELNHIKSKFPSNIYERYDCFFQGIFHIYRLNRNDVGHPTGAYVDKNTMLGSLTLFIPYCKLLYGIIEYINANPL